MQQPEGLVGRPIGAPSLQCGSSAMQAAPLTAATRLPSLGAPLRTPFSSSLRCGGGRLMLAARTASLAMRCSLAACAPIAISASAAFSTEPSTTPKPGFAPGAPVVPPTPTPPPPGTPAASAAAAATGAAATAAADAGVGGASRSDPRLRSFPPPSASAARTRRSLLSPLGWVVPIMGLPLMALYYFYQKEFDAEWDQKLQKSVEELRAMRQVPPGTRAPPHQQLAAPPPPKPAAPEAPAVVAPPPPKAPAAPAAPAPAAPPAPLPPPPAPEAKPAPAAAPVPPAAPPPAPAPAAPTTATAAAAAPAAVTDAAGAILTATEAGCTAAVAAEAAPTPAAANATAATAKPQAPAPPRPSPAKPTATGPAAALPMCSNDILAAVTAAAVAAGCSVPSDPLPAGLPDGSLGLEGYDLSPLGLIRNAVTSADGAVADWSQWPERHAQAVADSQLLFKALSKAAQWHTAEIERLRSELVAMKQRADVLQAEGEAAVASFKALLRQQAETTRELVQLEVRQAEIRTRIAAEKARLAEASSRTAALDEVRLALGALAIAHEQRRTAAASARNGHVLAAGAAAMAAAADGGVALTSAASGLRGVAPSDPLVGAVVGALPQGPVSTRMELLTSFRRLRRDLAALSYLPGESAGLVAVAVARLAAMIKLDESSAVKVLGPEYGAGGVDAALARTEALLAAGQLSAAAEVLAGALAGTAAAALGADFVDALRRRASAEAVVAALNGHAAATWTSMA